MNLLLPFSLIGLFCIDYYAIYHKTTNLNTNLTIKQKSQILSIKSSLTLLLLGLVFNYKFISADYNYDNYITNLGFTSTFITELSIYNFIAYLIMDCYIGHKEYHTHLCSLSGYFHHFTYIGINFLSIYKKLSPVYLLYMIEELPTILLSLGSFNKNLRNNYLFGSAFFLTRICYHIFLTFIFRKHLILVNIASLSLILHIYWFFNWVKKYVKKIK